MRNYVVKAIEADGITDFCVTARDYEHAEAIADGLFPNAMDFEITEVSR